MCWSQSKTHVMYQLFISVIVIYISLSQNKNDYWPHTSNVSLHISSYFQNRTVVYNYLQFRQNHTMINDICPKIVHSTKSTESALIMNHSCVLKHTSSYHLINWLWNTSQEITTRSRFVMFCSGTSVFCPQHTVTSPALQYDFQCQWIIPEAYK